MYELCPEIYLAWDTSRNSWTLSFARTFYLFSFEINIQLRLSGGTLRFRTERVNDQSTALTHSQLRKFFEAEFDCAVRGYNMSLALTPEIRQPTYRKKYNYTFYIHSRNSLPYIPKSPSVNISSSVLWSYSSSNVHKISRNHFQVGACH